MTRRPEPGWLPYLAPYFVFLAILEIKARLPESVAPYALFFQVLVPLGIFVFYLRRGAFPELRGYPRGAGGVALDVVVGVATAALWIVPYLFTGGLSHPGPEEGFDPDQLGEALRGVTLSTRLVGFALVTPFLEELFVRSFLLRAAELVSFPRTGKWKFELEIDGRTDFRDLPMARYTRWGFGITVIYFMLSHAPWEWPVALATGIAWNLYLYHRGHIAPLVLVHAVTNFTLFWVVILTGSSAGPGGVLDLGFFL